MQKKEFVDTRLRDGNQSLWDVTGLKTDILISLGPSCLPGGNPLRHRYRAHGGPSPLANGTAAKARSLMNALLFSFIDSKLLLLCFRLQHPAACCDSLIKQSG